MTTYILFRGEKEVCEWREYHQQFWHDGWELLGSDSTRTCLWSGLEVFRSLVWEDSHDRPLSMVNLPLTLSLWGRPKSRLQGDGYDRGLVYCFHFHLAWICTKGGALLVIQTGRKTKYRLRYSIVSASFHKSFHRGRRRGLNISSRYYKESVAQGGGEDTTRWHPIIWWTITTVNWSAFTYWSIDRR